MLGKKWNNFLMQNVRKMGRVQHLPDSCLYSSSQCREPGEKINELSANTVAFISCRSRLTKVLADPARGGKEERLSEVTGC